LTLFRLGKGYGTVFLRQHCTTDRGAATSDAWQNRGRKFVVHMDNAIPHKAKLTKSCFKTLRLREVDHPPYSPDPARSDFYLFGRLKR
jgi:hypothetical protein